MLEIRLTKYRLVLNEVDLESLLARDRTLWALALRRGWRAAAAEPIMEVLQGERGGML
jgi:hypothetical protein